VICSIRVEPIAERDNVTFQEILSRNQEALFHFLSEECTFRSARLVERQLISSQSSTQFSPLLGRYNHIEVLVLPVALSVRTLLSTASL
jgi:hypothetical protein